MGEPEPDQWLNRTSWSNWQRWRRFMALCSFGPLHEDLRFGKVCALLYNANRGKDDKPLGPDDFFPALKQAMGEADADGELTEDAIEARIKRENEKALMWVAIFTAQAERTKAAAAPPAPLAITES